VIWGGIWYIACAFADPRTLCLDFSDPCLWLQHSIPMADGGVGGIIFTLSYFKMLFYQKQNIKGRSPAQSGNSYQLSIYETLCLSKIIDDIYVYNGDFRPAPGQKRLVMVMITMVEKHIFTSNFFVSITTDTLPMTGVFVLW
jgi:hypothetical protein